MTALSAATTTRMATATAVAIGTGLVVLTAIPWWHGITTRTPLRETLIHGNWTRTTSWLYQLNSSCSTQRS